MAGFTRGGHWEYVVASKDDLIRWEIDLAMYARGSITYGVQSAVKADVGNKVTELCPEGNPPCGFKITVHHINPDNPEDYRVDVVRVEESELQKTGMV